MSDVFYRLAPFIQDFIYYNKWTELRGIQVAACETIFDTKSNLLLSSGTASGKTEAAFLPVLTELYNKPSASVGVLYISPLKALINDQFKRLDQLLMESDIPVCKWHGDASVAKKNALIKNPAGILQITPESLESLLINKRGTCYTLFSDLRYVIIDEVHHFMRDVRGVQVLCQLERLQNIIGYVPRRIGLSATLGDIDLAKNWLNTGTNNDCIAPITDEGKKAIKLFVQRFTNDDNDENNAWKDQANQRKPEINQIDKNLETKDSHSNANQSQSGKNHSGQYKGSKSQNNLNQISAKNVVANNSDSALRAQYEYLFKMTLDKKTIIFTNSREETEFTLSNLREIALKNKAPDVYRVHHGNVSALLREQTEDEMKYSEEKIVTGATVTLELGIDIGNLDQVVQIGAPINVSSFAQRLGRCGRRGQIPQLLFTFVEDTQATAADTLGPINWGFIRLIAIIELYTKEKWIEPILPHKHPYSLLYHQTMCCLKSNGELSPAKLAEMVLSLESFREISQDDYKILLNHLVSIEHLQKTELGGLIIGRAGEKVVNHYNFYTVFIVPEYYLVKDENKSIGTVDKIYPVGTRFSLAGMTWETVDVNVKSKVIFVKKVPGIAIVDWKVDFKSELHTVLVRKIRNALKGDDTYPYLSESCRERLKELRYLTRNSGILDNLVTPLSEHRFAIFPWVGTRQLFTLHYALVQRGIKSKIPWNTSVYLEAYYQGNAHELKAIIQDILHSNIDVNTLPLPEKIEIENKYNEFVPLQLLRKQFVKDFLDFEGLKNAMKNDK